MLEDYPYRYDMAIARRRMAPDEVGDAELYAIDPEFRHCCDRILEMHGIQLDWVTVDMILWLIFPRQVKEKIVPSPLQIINAFREPRHPTQPSDGERTDAVALLAAMFSHCGGDYEKTMAMATSPHGVEVIEALNLAQWNSLTPKQQNDLDDKAWAAREQKKELDLWKASMGVE